MHTPNPRKTVKQAITNLNHGFSGNGNGNSLTITRSWQGTSIVAESPRKRAGNYRLATCLADTIQKKRWEARVSATKKGVALLDGKPVGMVIKAPLNPNHPEVKNGWLAVAHIDGEKSQEKSGPAYTTDATT